MPSFGSMFASLSLESTSFMSGIRAAQKELKATQKTFAAVGANMAKAGAVLTVGLTAPFTALMSQAIPAANESAQAMGQVEAALKSMGPVAGRTKDQLADAATELMHLSTFDDDEILRKVTANLLTFGKVASTQFDRAQLAAVNLSTRMSGDLQAATILIGKALNDPIKGMGALRKVGIQLSDQQKEQVKAFDAAGNAAGAQGVILSELERQFGGSAKAMRDATPGADLKNAWDDFQETIGAFAVRVLPPLTNGLAKVVNAFNDLSPATQATIVGVAAVGAALGPVIAALGGVVTVVGALLPVFAALAPVALPLAAAAAALGAAGYLIYQNWDKIAPVLTEAGSAILKAIGPDVTAALGDLKSAFSDLWNGPLGAGIRLAVVELVKFEVAFAKVFGPAIIAQVRNMATVLGATIRSINSLLKGEWTASFMSAGAVLTGLTRIVDLSFGGLPGKVIGYISQMVTGIRLWIVDKLNAVWATARDGVETVRKAFFNLYDAVVGHSYVPDMVDQIGVHMARLSQTLVAPAKAATDRAAEAFRNLAQAVAPILDRLFPQQARENGFATELKAITDYAAKAGWTVDQTAEAVRRLRDEFAKDGGIAPGSTGGDIVRQNPGSLPGVDWEGEADKFGDQIRAHYEKVKAANDNLAVSFADTFRDIAGSIGNFVNDLKNGDWLSALQSILDVVAKVAGAIKGGGGDGGGVGGGGFDFGGFRARGGSALAGRTYMVGERGPELLRMGGASGYIVPNDEIGGASGGPAVIQLVMDEGAAFEPRVRAISGDVSVEHVTAFAKGQARAIGGRLGRG